VRGLVPGVTLGEAFPEFMPSAPVVPSSALAVSQPVLAVATSASSSSASAPSPVMCLRCPANPRRACRMLVPQLPNLISRSRLAPAASSSGHFIARSAHLCRRMPLCHFPRLLRRSHGPPFPPRPICVVVPSMPAPSAPVVDSARLPPRTRAAKKRAAAASSRVFPTGGFMYEVQAEKKAATLQGADPPSLVRALPESKAACIRGRDCRCILLYVPLFFF